jgi:hypothetical protein
MTDRLEAAVRNGKQAAVLMDDPVLKDALDKLEQAAIEALVTCFADELLERRAEVSAIRKFRAVLRVYIDNGKIAKASLPN